jgi:hypothetical protein
MSTTGATIAWTAVTAIGFMSPAYEASARQGRTAEGALPIRTASRLNAVGLLIMHDFRLLFTAYPRDLAGDPLGPSRFAPGTPYWLALIAMGARLAARNPGRAEA